MHTLSLYIDRWYIIAAHSSGNTPRRIELPNQDDRIWLFFYEDTNNDLILYGRNYKSHFLNKENNYYGDIFSKIVKDDATFKHFDRDVKMKEIFKVAKIFYHLKEAFPDQKEISTFVSFSLDVNYAAQKIFLDILKENGFCVKESVVPLSHLGLELSLRKGNLIDPKYIFVAVASNENLYYSIYKYTGNIFLRHSEKAGYLSGHGTDLRGLALIEEVIKQINSTTRFLQGDKLELEKIRLSQNIENWLDKIDSSPYPIVKFHDITFAIAPHNTFDITILKSVIEEKTKITIDNVVNQWIKHITESRIEINDISHILLIGNSFTNSMFRKALCKNITLCDDQIISYQEKNLPEIVSIYNQLDLSQFDSDRSNFKTRSEDQLQQIKNAEEERKNREIATRQKEEADKKNKESLDAKRRYNDAMEAARDYELRGDYGNMIDYLKIALSLYPDDTEAKQLIEEATRKRSELKVTNEKYNTVIRSAQEALDKQRWEEAYTKSETALNLRPDAKEAKRIKEEAFRRINIQKELKDLLIRIDVFIAKKAFSEAQEELRKARLLDVEEKDIVEREEKIKKEQEITDQTIIKLTNLFNSAVKENRFDEALAHCNELIEVDFTNYRKWQTKLSEIEIKKEKEAERQRRWEELNRKINDAQWNEDWGKIVDLCKEALTLKDTVEIRKILERAEEKLRGEKERKLIDDLLSEIKDLILDSQLTKAKEKLRSLDQKSLNLEYKAKVKELHRLIFKREEELEPSRKPSSKSTTTTINSKNENDKFFGHTHKNGKTNQNSITSNENQITNDDFNF